MKKICVALMLLLTTAAFAGAAAEKAASVERLQSSAVILSQIMEAPDKAIPDSIMDGAKCIAVVPSMLKASFIFGANYGRGVATCRTASAGWSSPVFFRVEGGSFGFQAGGQASDLVLVIRTVDGMQYLLQSKFKLGADASAAAGPVGRDSQAATDLTMRAQILTYSLARGLFAGVSVNGAVVHQDGNATQAFYGQDYLYYSLLKGEVAPPADAQNFLKTVELYAPSSRLSKTAHAHPPASATTTGITPVATGTAPPAADSVSAPESEAAPAATSAASPTDPTASAAPAADTTKTSVPAPAAKTQVPAAPAPADPAEQP
jgi:lipid-binding SYLF domain-containing protein